MKVKALKLCKELSITIPEAGGIPEEGQEFEIKEERLEVLTGKNTFGKAFVEVIEKSAPIIEDTNEYVEEQPDEEIVGPKLPDKPKTRKKSNK